MRTIDDIKKVISLHKVGKNNCEISRELNIPRGTIKSWILNHKNGEPQHKINYHNLDEQFYNIFTDEQKKYYTYILGLYLGDGHIIKSNRVYKLRIYQDAKYVGLINECVKSLEYLFTKNKIGIYNHGKNCKIIAVYNKHLPTYFPQHGKGIKYKRKIELTKWQTNIINEYPEQLIRGLIHSDGCIGIGNNGYMFCDFSQVSNDIKNIFCKYCDILGIKYKKYKLRVSIRRQAEIQKILKFVEIKF